MPLGNIHSAVFAIVRWISESFPLVPALFIICIDNIALTIMDCNADDTVTIKVTLQIQPLNSPSKILSNI